MKLDHAVSLTGIDELSDAQSACVKAAVDGRDVLAVISTGGGKSAIYQLTGAMIDGPTVVVIPLLALAEDQQLSIDASELPSSARIDGNTGSQRRAEVLAKLGTGEIEYLFTTPEMLQNSSVNQALRACDVSLLVVDEAHCVVTWGQSFRSDYLLLGDVRRDLGSPTCIALTASADPRIRQDLIRLLALHDPLVTVLPLLRDNIELTLHRAPDRRQARSAFIDHLAAASGKAVGYVPTRRDCDEIATILGDRGVAARPYHGGMSRRDRQAAADELRTRPDSVIIATNAFGMGIDIPDITTVAHLELPATLIDYYQEVGRAGRDGRPARGDAFVGLRRRSRRTFTSGVHATTVAECAAVHGAIRSGTSSRRRLADELDMSIGGISRAVTVLAMAGAIQATRRLRTTDLHVTTDDIADVCRQREEFDRSQRQAVAAYRTSDRCRWQQLLAALGEPAPACGACDNCIAAGGDGGGADELAGTVVEHRLFGTGRIVSVDGSTALVSFAEAGPKSLDLDLCTAQGLIEPPQ